ncbi:MAG: PilZ domain-containing protein [Spirochaetota bacterium]
MRKEDASVAMEKAEDSPLKRLSTRISLESECSVCHQKSRKKFVGKVSNLSIGGLKAFTSADIYTGDLLQLEFQLGKNLIKLSGIVIRVSGNSFIIRNVYSSLEEKNKLLKYIYSYLSA